MKQKAFCPFCGSHLTDKFFEGMMRRFCEKCNDPIYENPVPASCMVVADDKNRVLLVKRSVWPKKGDWCLPGGYMELNETPEQCALRELREETGLSGRIKQLLGVTASQNQLYGTVLMIGYLVDRHSGCINPGDDVSDAAYFEYNALPKIAFKSHDNFLRIYFAVYSS